MNDCGSCGYRRKLWTTREGYRAFCLHPKSIDPIDGIAMYVIKARDPGQPCGPGGHLHSANEARMGHVSLEQWRTLQ